MSDDTPSTPLPRQLAAVDPRTDLKAFSPNVTQARAKARLHAQLRERAETVDFATLSATELAELAGTQRLLQWLREPGFALWLSDRDAYVYDALALRETAVRVVADVLTSDYEPKILTAKDKLKAADMLFTLTGAYPSKTKEVRYVDRDLDNMSDDEVQRQLAETKQKLKQLPD